ncbi:MAG: DUF4124 domain-containing protein [Steroidobacteraceae bacterium]
MRALLLTITLLASAGALAATTVYTWVDEQGVTHFSDQPHSGAAKLQVQNAPTYSAPPTPQVDTAAQQRATTPRAECSIASPTDQQMFMNAWSVSGQVQLPRNLQAGARVILLLDGKVLPNAASLSGAFTIPQVDRGAHTLAAQVESAGGQVICEAPAITFFVHQPSDQAPNPANRPRF